MSRIGRAGRVGYAGAAVGLTLLTACGLCAVAGEKQPVKATPAGAPAWYDSLKNIEMGPGNLDIGAGLRLRYDNRKNYDVKAYNGAGTNDDMSLERAWLDLNCRFDGNNRVFVRLQDAHFRGSRFSESDFSPHCSVQDPLDVREAYVELKQVGGTPMGIKAGRQIIAYGDQSVWGPGDWGNAGKFTWDGVKLIWNDKAAQIDAICAKRVLADPNDINDDYDKYSAYGIYAAVKNLPCALDLFYVLKKDSHKSTGGESGTNSLALHTVGAYVSNSASEGLTCKGTVLAQFGDWGNDDVSAFGLKAAAGYTFAAPCKPGISVGYSYASGDSNPGDGTHETLDPVFQSAHGPYGLMDVVSWKNLEDYQVDLSVKPGSRLGAVLSWHCFRLAEEKDAWYFYSEKAARRDKTGASGADLGQELDLSLNANVAKGVKIEGGYGKFLAGDFVKNTGAHDDADWFFAQTTMSF